TWV
ncbi:hypothetical protein VCHENC02_2390, partial [Vibrio harveyi]